MLFFISFGLPSIYGVKMPETLEESAKQFAEKMRQGAFKEAAKIRSTAGLPDDMLQTAVKEAYDKFQPLAVVADTGGLGKKIADEVAMRTGIPLEAADKLRKNEHIEWVNDALRTRALFVPSESRFAQDALLLEWDKSNPEKWKWSDRFHSDTADALLYAYVRALHWLEKDLPAPLPAMNTPEWFERQAQLAEAQNEEMLQEAIEERRREREHEQDLADLL